MDPQRFDRLAKTLSHVDTRRRLMGLLAALPLGVTLTALLGHAPEAAAKKQTPRPLPDDDHGSSHRRQRRRARHRHRPGQDQRRNKEPRKRKGKGKRKDKDKGTTDCVKRTCPPGTCGSQPDGCGGTLDCGCSSTQLCHQGACQVCTVTCPSGGDPVACGADLQAKMSAGGTVYVCPGRYGGRFDLPVQPLTVIGAGDGATEANDTILDGLSGLAPVVTVPRDATVTLARLRITGAKVPATFPGGISNESTLTMIACSVTDNIGARVGGGIFNRPGATLTMSGCTVSDNKVVAFAPQGGGIYNEGTLTMTDCEVSRNSSLLHGGGIASFGPGRTVRLTGCRIERNTAELMGGGIYAVSETDVTLDGTTVRLNGAAAAGGIWNESATVNLLTTTKVTGNTPTNCEGPGTYTGASGRCDP